MDLRIFSIWWSPLLIHNSYMTVEDIIHSLLNYTIDELRHAPAPDHDEAVNSTSTISIGLTFSEDPIESETPDWTILPIDDDLAAFVYTSDVCLALFSCLNLVVNIWLLILSFGFVRNGCSSSNDTHERRPHYGLHLFIFNCALSAVFLEAVGVITNVGFLFLGENIFVYGIENVQTELVVRKTLDFLTYSLFNVTHLNFVLLLNVDKLLFILKPLHYHQLMNRRRVCLICILTWFVALAMASPSLTYLDTTAQLRQEAILFAMCVVCPAAFDLLSAIIVSTIVFRIQLKDSNTRRSVMGNRYNYHVAETGSTNHASMTGTTKITCASSEPPNGITRSVRTSVTTVRTIRKNRSRFKENFFRHFNVFLRTFTPIIWTCVTTLPYTSTMIYLYFGAADDEDFIRRWTDDTNFRVLRALGCLYIIYFTGLPFIIVFNYYPYRRKIKIATRFISKRLHSLHRRVYTHRYHAVAKHDNDIVIGITSTTLDGYAHTNVTAL